jgi:hypothetical protein
MAAAIRSPSVSVKPRGMMPTGSIGWTSAVVGRAALIIVVIALS